MTTLTKPDTTNPTFREGPLPVLISARVRLSDEQKRVLKNTYYSQLNDYASPAGQKIGASSVSSVTHILHPLQRQFGSIVMSDILTSKDTLALDVLLQIQSLLGVTVIEPKDIHAACQHYTDYLWGKYYTEGTSNAC